MRRYVIDDETRRIEKACIDLVSLQQPVAGDMRLITGSYKIVILTLFAAGGHAASEATAKLEPQMASPPAGPDLDVESAVEEYRADLDLLVFEARVAASRVAPLRSRGARWMARPFSATCSPPACSPWTSASGPARERSPSPSRLIPTSTTRPCGTRTATAPTTTTE